MHVVCTYLQTGPSGLSSMRARTTSWARRARQAKALGHSHVGGSGKHGRQLTQHSSNNTMIRNTLTGYMHPIAQPHYNRKLILHDLGGRHSTAVTRPHCNDKDVGSNPAAARNENWTLGWPPAQKVPQWSNRI